MVVRSREGTLIQQFDLAVLIDDLLDRAARAIAGLKGDGDIRGRRFRNLIAGLDLRVVRGRQLDRTVRQDHSSRGDLDILLGVGLRGIGIGAGHGRIVIRLDLDAAVILGAFQTVFAVRRDDDIVFFLTVIAVQLAILTGQFDGTIRIDLGPDRRQDHVAVRGDLSSSLIGLIARLPIQELVAAVGKGVLGQSLGSLTGNGVDLNFLAAAVVRLVGQNHSGFGIVGAAVLILDVRIGAVGAGNGDRVVRLAVVIRIRQVDDDGAIGLEDTAVRQSDLAVRGDDAAASGDLDVAGGVVAGYRLAVAVGRHVVTSSVGVTILTGDRDRAVSVGLIPLRVPGLIHIGRYIDHGVGRLEVAGAVSRGIPAAEGPTGHSEGICRSQVRREHHGSVGANSFLDLICRAVVGQVDDLGGVIKRRLAPLRKERRALRISGKRDRFTLVVRDAAAAVVRRVPAREGLAAVGERVLNGGDGFAALYEDDHIVAGTAVGLVDHGDVALRRCIGQVGTGFDLTAVRAVRRLRQLNGSVRLHDGALRDFDVLSAIVGMVRVLGPVDRAAVILDLDAAVRLRGDCAAVIRGDDNIIVLFVTGAIQVVVLTGQLHGAVQVFLDPVCEHPHIIRGVRCVIGGTRGVRLLVGADPAGEGVAGPDERIFNDLDRIALDDLDLNIGLVVLVVVLIDQSDDLGVRIGLTVLVGDIRLRRVSLAGDGDRTIIGLAVAVLVRAVDDDRAVGQEFTAVRHTDHGAVRQSHAAALGDLDLALIVAAGLLVAVAIAGGVGVRIIGITIGTGNGDGAIGVDSVPLCKQLLGIAACEAQDGVALIERTAAVGLLIPAAERPVGNLIEIAGERCLEVLVGVVTHNVGHIPPLRSVGFIGDGCGIGVLCVPLGVKRDAGVNSRARSIGLAAAETAVVPFHEVRAAGISEQAALDFEYALLADLLLHFLGSIVGIIGDCNEAFGKVSGDVLIGADLTAIGVRQNDGAVRLHNRTTGNGNIFLALVGVIRVRGTGNRRSAVIGHLYALVAVINEGLVHIVRGHGHVILVLRRGHFSVLAGEDNGAIRALVGDGEGRRLFSRLHRDTHRSIGDVRGHTIIKGIGLCGVAVKGGDFNGVVHADERFHDILFGESRAAIEVIDGDRALILGCVGLLVVPDEFHVILGIADGDFVVEAVREFLSSAAVHAGDADQLIAGAVGREEVGSASFQHILRGDLRRLRRAQNDLRIDGHKVLGVVEVDRVLAVAGHVDNLLLLTGIQRVSAVAQVLRRGDGQFLAAGGLGGVGRKSEVARSAPLGATHIVDCDGAGSLGLVPEVDFQVALVSCYGVRLGQVVIQRPAVEGLRRSHVGFTHTGSGHRCGLNAGDLSGFLLLRRCGIEIVLAQLGAVHGDVCHLPRNFLEVDAVFHCVAADLGSNRAVASGLKIIAGPVIRLVGVVIAGQIQNVLACAVGLAALAVQNGDELACFRIVEPELDIAQRFVLELHSLSCCQRAGDRLGQCILQRHVGTGRGRDNDVLLADAIAGQFHIAAQLRAAVVLLHDDLRGSLRKMIGDLGVHHVRHLGISCVIASDLIADVGQRVAGNEILDITLLVLHLRTSAGALGDHLVIGIEFLVRMIHKANGVLDKAGVPHGFVLEGDDSAVRDAVMADLHELIGAVCAARDCVAAQSKAAHDGGLDGDLITVFQSVLVRVIGRDTHVRVGGAVVQLDGDRLGIIQRVLELHHLAVVCRGHDLVALLVLNRRIAGPAGAAHRSLLTLDGADGVSLKDLALARQVDGDVHIAAVLILAIPEHDLRTVAVRKERRGGIAALGGVAAGGCHRQVVGERMVLANGQAVKDLLTVDLLAGIRVHLDDGDACRLALVLIGDLDLTDAVVLAAGSERLTIYSDGRVSSSALVIGHIGCLEGRDIDGVAVGLGAAVLAEQFGIAGLGDEHHVSGVLGVLKCHNVVAQGGKRLGLLRCRVAGDGGGDHAGLLTDLLLHGVGGAQIGAVARGLDGHGSLGALVGQSHRDGAALGVRGNGNIELIIGDLTEHIISADCRTGQRIAGDALLGVDGVSAGPGCGLHRVGVEVIAAVHLAGHLNVHHLLRDGHIVDGLFRVGSGREFQCTAVQVDVLTVQR